MQPVTSRAGRALVSHPGRLEKNGPNTSRPRDHETTNLVAKVLAKTPGGALADILHPLRRRPGLGWRALAIIEPPTSPPWPRLSRRPGWRALAVIEHRRRHRPGPGWAAGWRALEVIKPPVCIGVLSALARPRL